MKALTSLLIVFCLGLAAAAQATSLTYNGGVSGSWTNTGSGWLDGLTAANWNNATPDSAIFAGATPTSVNVDGGVTVGNISVTSGTYALGGTGTLTLSNTTWDVASGLTNTVSTALAGSTGLIKTGAGILLMSGANKNYTGTTVINGGAIQITNVLAGNLGSTTTNAITLNGGALYANFAANTTPSYAITVGASGGELRNINTTGRYVFGSNFLNGNGTLTLTFGTGAQRFGATGTGTTQANFSGKWVIDGNGGNAANGFLDLWADQNLGTGSGDDFLTLKNGGKVLFRGFTFSKGVTVGAGGGQIANGGGLSTAISGKISGDATNALTFDLGGSAISYVTLSNTGNSWLGTTTLSSQGVLKLGASGVMADTGGNLQFSNASAVFDLNGFNEAIGGLSGNGIVDNRAASTASVLTVGGNDQSTTFSGVMSNSGGSGATLALVKSGAGTLTLSGSNSYSGGTTVKAGKLIAGNAGALGSGAVTLQANSTNSRAALGLSGVTISGNTLVMDSTTNRAGLTSLGSSGSTWDGTITLQGGTSALGNTELTSEASGAPLTVKGTIGGSISGGGYLTLRGANSTNVMDATINIGSTAITKVDAGNTWRINSSGNTFGTLTIDSGKILLGSSDALPNTGSNVVVNASGTLDVNGYSETMGGLSGAGTVDNSGAAATLTAGGNNESTTFSGVLTNSGSALGLTKTGAGTLTLSGSNSFSGGTTVQAGKLIVANANALGAGNVLVQSTAAGAGNRAYLTLNNLTVSGKTLTMDSTTNRATLLSTGVAGATWNGTITLQGGTSTNGSTELANDTGNGPLTVAGTVNGSITNNGSLTLRGIGVTNVLSAGVSIGSTPVVKTDTGAWRITSSGNTWGTTTISSGTLEIGANNALPDASSITMAASTKLDLMGTSSDAVGTLSLTGNATITFGLTGNAQTLAFANSSALDWSSFKLTISGYEQATDSLRFGTTSSGLTAGQLANINFDGYDPGAVIDASGYVSPVPEPSTYALLGMGGVACWGYVLRRRKR